MASEDYLELCFVGLVLGENYVWCLVIVVILMGFGQARAKRYGILFKSHELGWQCTPQEPNSFYKGKGGSHYVILLY